MNAIFLGVLTGIDNFAVSAGFGAQGLSPGRRLSLIAGFAGFEVLMPLVGFALLTAAGAERVEVLGPMFVILAGALVAWTVWRGVEGLARSGWLLALAPLALSLDNLALGAGMSAGGFGVGIVLTSGLVAAALTVAGLALGSVAVRRLRFNPQVGLAGCLVLVGTLELAGGV